mmetsp:Transcript_5903/g.7523  ORF Transcript_5903/g.7523 Transcript_5903/m.7523 type:complete len:220 (-) Transcript_5903:76-735(-)
MLAVAKPGDILLFSGIASGAFVICRFTKSPYSHVAMVVQEDKLFYGKPLLLQTTCSVHFDLIRNKRTSGCQLNCIDVQLQDSKSMMWVDPEPENPAIVTFRSIQRPKRSLDEEQKMSEALLSFIQEKNGLPYTNDMEGLYVMGLLKVDLENESETNYYCANRMAYALIKYGSIENMYLHQQYGPHDFSAMYQSLPFVDANISYGSEVMVDWLLLNKDGR